MERAKLADELHRQFAEMPAMPGQEFWRAFSDIARALCGPTAAGRELIEAALHWRDRTTGDRTFIAAHHQRLSCAADAMIAERTDKPRYTVKETRTGFAVMDSESPAPFDAVWQLSLSASKIDAERIAQALNAESRDG